MTLDVWVPFPPADSMRIIVVQCDDIFPLPSFCSDNGILFDKLCKKNAIEWIPNDTLESSLTSLFSSFSSMILCACCFAVGDMVGEAFEGGG